jgi:hypothetical protein
MIVAPISTWRGEQVSGIRKVGLGSDLAVPLTSGGGLLSGVKLKKAYQKLTLGSKVGLLQEAAILRGGIEQPGVAKGRHRSAPQWVASTSATVRRGRHRDDIKRRRQLAHFQKNRFRVDRRMHAACAADDLQSGSISGVFHPESSRWRPA